MFKYPASIFRNFLFNNDPPCHGLNRGCAEAGLQNIASSLRWRFRRSLSMDFVEILNIWVLDLDLSDKLPSAPVYFQPLTTAEIQAHPIVDDKESQEYLAQFDQTLKKIAAGESGMDALQIAETFAARLRHELCGFNRVGINKIKGKNLLALTDFYYKEKFPPSVINKHFYHTVFLKKGSRTAPVGVWYDLNFGKVPHMIFSLKHEYDWGEDLLTTEVYLITSSMQSRMKCFCTYRKMVIPVMIFSFGKEQGRIVQAFWNGESLIVRKSKLLDLFDPSVRAFEIFARFAASKPVGNTDDLPHLWVPEYDRGNKDGNLSAPRMPRIERRPGEDINERMARLADKREEEIEEKKKADREAEELDFKARAEEREARAKEREAKAKEREAKAKDS